jgi:hypothetical protein
LTGSDRVYHGEGVISYSQRHAARNHSDIADIEHGIRQRGVRLPKTRGVRTVVGRSVRWQQATGGEILIGTVARWLYVDPNLAGADVLLKPGRPPTPTSARWEPWRDKRCAWATPARWLRS